MTRLVAAERPTLHFIGVTTAGSSIMRVFPAWAAHLGLADAAIAGIDLPLNAEPEAYRAAVRFLKADPLSRGALVTTHKLDLFAACRDLFDRIDPLAELMAEVSCLSKPSLSKPGLSKPGGATLTASAKDPVTAGLTLDGFLPPRHFADTGAELLVLGAGGSALAITWHLTRPERGADRPARVIVTDREAGRLRAVRQMHAQLGHGIPVEAMHVTGTGTSETDARLWALPPGSLVVNATGLGKDRPGSPLGDAARFPERGIAWDLNYRGALDFLAQARRQQAARAMQIEDGWRYFIHGWSQVIAEVFAIPIDGRGPVIDELSRLAGALRPAPSPAP